MSPGYARALDTASTALTALFAAEVAAKLAGLGAWGFASDAFNLFDALVVALGLLELALTVRGAAAQGRAGRHSAVANPAAPRARAPPPPPPSHCTPHPAWA